MAAAFTFMIVKCVGCEQEKSHSPDNFNLVTETRRGKEYQYIKRRCKPCLHHARMEYYRRNNVTERYKRRCKANYSSNRASMLKSKYGVTPEQFDEMLKAQNFKCAICGTDKNERHRFGRKIPFHVDHCHETGIVRGLLCGHCNRGLGDFRDSVSALEKAATYLKRFSDA